MGSSIKKAEVPTYSQRQVQIEALLPLRFQRISMGFPSRSPSHRHAFHEIGITLSGSATHFCGGKKFALEPGWFYVLAPGETHHLATRKPWVVENIYFLPDHLGVAVEGFASGKESDLFHRLFWPRPGPLCHFLSAPAFQAVRHLLEAGKHHPPNGARPFHTHLFFSILSILNEALGEIGPPETAFPPDPRIRVALTAIESHLDAEGGQAVAAVVSSLGLTREYASSYFHQKVGSTLRDYILKRRVSRACSLLIDGLPAGEVARRCGFYDGAHFTRAFHKVLGCTPKAYRAGVRMGLEGKPYPAG